MRAAPSRFEVEVVGPRDLRTCEVVAWKAMQEDDLQLANPLLGPDFVRAVGRVRDDARVAVFRLKGEPVAFLPFHQRMFGLARPIGAPFSDYQALVSKKDIDLTGEDALRLAGLTSFRFNGLYDPRGAFPGLAPAKEESFAIQLDGDPDEYLEGIRAASPKRFKNYRRLEHRMEREYGPMRFVADDRSRSTFHQLLSWKQDQFRRTGLQDVLRPEWVQTLMQNIFDMQGAGARGLMMSLYAGDVLLAGHFGLRSKEVYHPWIASANPAAAAESPGVAFLGHAIRAMPQLGLKVYDLGPGHDHYKRPYANVSRTMLAGSFNLGRSADPIAARFGAAGKIGRRIDHICTVDPTPGGVLRGLVEAAAGLSKRGLGNHTLSDAVA